MLPFASFTPTTQQTFFSFQRMIHSVLTGRMLLQLCQYGNKLVHDGRQTQLTDDSVPLEPAQPVFSD